MSAKNSVSADDSMIANDSCFLSEISWYGIQAYSFGNSRFAAIMVPTLGGKIASLIDLKYDREWMWKNPDLEPVVLDSKSSYLRHLGGWDECFPSVAETNYPCPPWQDVVIPDHGEIWSRQWQTETLASENHVDIIATTSGAQLPYKFKRVISIDSDSPVISFSYTVENTSSYSMPFVWSSHPTLAVRPGDKISMPAQPISLYKSLDDQFGSGGEIFTWPHATDVHGKLWDFSVLEKTTSPASIKLFTAKAATNAVSIEDASTMARLEFKFDTNLISHVGIWLNFNAWSCVEGGPKYFCAAIEPCLSGTDSLSEAFKMGCPKIPPNGTYSWALSIELRGN